jgi:chromosome segregation ATPase
LQDDLEAQRSKNNELRTKNWKVMEALTVAESRAKSNSGKCIDDDVLKMRIAEQESTKSLLQRIFPEIEIKEQSYDNWFKLFEEHVNNVLSETNQNDDMVKQNKKLQSLVTHYKEIIADTEGMLNNLQSHVESAESRWQSELRQKESDVVNLRIELKELQNKSTINDELQEKISQLESRLAEKEAIRQTTKQTMVEKNESAKSENNLAMIEQLQEEKLRLSQELQIERKNKATVDSELNKLRAFVEKNEITLAQQKNTMAELQTEVAQMKSDTHGASSNSDQSTANGPPTSDSSKSEGGSGKK